MNPNIITYLCTLAAGILFIIFRQDTNIIDTLTLIAALIFLIPGVINFVQALKSTRRRESAMGTAIGLMLVSAGAIALGILMIIIPDTFKDYVVIVLGILIMLCGIYQFVHVYRRLAGPKTRWFLVGSVLVFIAGFVVAILKTSGLNANIWLAIGIILIAYSVNGFIALKVLPEKTKDSDGQTIVI